MPAASHSLEKRDYVINELVETEKNYVEVLTTLQRHFMRPLQSVIKDQDFKTIFSGIKVTIICFRVWHYTFATQGSITNTRS